MTHSVLLTGGCGYIGSHVAISLLESGYDVILYDNLSNSSESVVPVISQLGGRIVNFERGDILDTDYLSSILSAYKVDSVVHFAGLKSVSASILEADLYYRTNVGGSLSLLEAMGRVGVRRLLYSSTAAIYGEVDSVPMLESAIASPVNPYGRSKWLVEQILRDVAVSMDVSFASLRYFNPVGAHVSGLLGENPTDRANNLVPLLMLAAGGGESLSIFGTDYATRDGTCIRDYIHISDLVSGHILGLDFLGSFRGYDCFNLGTSHGASVLEMLSSFEVATGVSVPHHYASRRSGDVSVLLADISKASEVLGWEARHTLGDMLSSAWKWHCHHHEL